MKKLITISMLFGIAYGQGGYLKPNNSYGTRSNRVAPDSVLHIPILSDTLSLNSTQTWPQIRVVGDSLWWYKGKWRNLSLSVTPGEVWKLTGNSGTVDATNFIGTTDNIPFNIRVNNQKSGRIDHLKFNTFYGYQSGRLVTTGEQNTASGAGTLQAMTTGGYNTALGYDALTLNTSSFNTAVGHSSLYNNSSGNTNTAIGNNSLLTNQSGSGNTGIGFNANMSASNLTNITVVGANSYATASNSLVLGSINGTNGAIADTKVGVGVTNPSERLDVVGNFKLTGKFITPSGANAIAGIATLSTGSVTVNTNKVATNSVIFLTRNTPSGTLGELSVPSASIVDGVSFTINSSSATETSTVNWFIIN
jgi:hypothetical protein